ncbi:SGNH/GDSL hydrolase family protein [Microlunatus sp. GCM10028923]|uniref:SGNH/GDSL hydrolase family protein n=1 Tax=Microlunatus sp. GCM10028923 TaxID=3273400 RepID=UPI003618C674
MIDRRRRTGAGKDRGVGALEYIGAIGIACLLIVTVVLAGLPAQIHQVATEAICKIIQQPGCAGQLALTPYQQALAGKYVAMGDSFASGEGAWDYEDGTNFDDRDDLWPFNDDEEDHNRCHRSENAYSQILAADNDFAGGDGFVACSGAVIDDFNDPNGANTDEKAQLDALDENTSLVTLSVGGNDLGFADVITDCVLNGESGVGFIDSCQEKHDKRIERRLPRLKQELITLYQKAKQKAPNARIVVVGYPPLFAQNPKDDYGNLLFGEDQKWMNEKAGDLNQILAEAAHESGVEFVDPTDAFKGHGLGTDDPWFNDLNWGGPGMMPVDPSSFHPNAKGHAAFAKLIQDQLENPGS